MAKKRKESPPSATLHDFFSRSEGSRTRKKPKVQPSPNLRLKKQKTPAERKVPTNVEIIVIDSDEEVAEICLPSKAVSTTVSGRAQSSYTELISSEHDKFVSTGLLPVDNLDSDDDGIASTMPAQSLDCGGNGTVSHVNNAKREPSPFGIPFLLLGSSSATTSSATNISGTSASTIVETTVQVITESRTADDDVKSSTATPPSEDVEREIAVVLGVPDSDDYWGTGDDELEYVDPDMPEGGDVDIDLTVDTETCSGLDIDLTLDDVTPALAAPDDRVERCPLCDMSLRGLCQEVIQRHVNDCIDSMASCKAPPMSPKRESMHPKAEMPHAGSSAIPHPVLRKSSPGSDASAFSMLMSSYKEVAAWKEASAAEDRNFRPTRANGGRRHAPFYKVLQGMPIAVDAFRYGTIPGITAYFLTHAHSDHYTNLSSNWKSGPIYCSEGTANLIVHMLGVDRKWVRPLPMDVPTVVPDTGGVSVTLIEANHCPGSCLFLFEGPQTVNAGDSAYSSPFVGSKRMFRYLHCGDFRASPQHVLHPSVKNKRIDHVYLDTTYLDPKYCFPPQPQVIAACAELARRIVRGEPLEDGDPKGKQKETMDSWVTVHEKTDKKEESIAGRVLVIVGTYSIGKERIVKAIARALGTKVFCDSRKEAILRCEADLELDALLTRDPLEGGVHLVPLGVIASDRLKDYVARFKGHYSRAIGFRPTGWTYTPPSGTDTSNIPSLLSLIKRAQSRTYTCANLRPTKNSSPCLQVYGVPYSEHSSFFELSAFALSLDWGRMIATVNVGSESGRKKMGRWIERWEAERKKGGGGVVQYRAPDYW